MARIDKGEKKSMDFGGESRRYLGEEHPRKRACLYSSFRFRGARSYLGQATLNLSKKEYKENERKEQQQKAAEERAKRAKERRNIEQQEVEVAVKRKHLNLIIIQQIVTMPIYGKEALDICHPYMTDILRYT